VVLDAHRQVGGATNPQDCRCYRARTAARGYALHLVRVVSVNIRRPIRVNKDRLRAGIEPRIDQEPLAVTGHVVLGVRMTDVYDARLE
jgi:hypothetical protein